MGSGERCRGVASSRLAENVAQSGRTIHNRAGYKGIQRDVVRLAICTTIYPFSEKKYRKIAWLIARSGYRCKIKSRLYATRGSAGPPGGSFGNSLSERQSPRTYARSPYWLWSVGCWQIASRRLHRDLHPPRGRGGFSLLGLGLWRLWRLWLNLRARGVQLARRRQGRDVRVLELGTLLALEDRTAFGEARGLVGLVGELALGVGLGQRAAVLHQLEQTAGVVVGGHAGGTAAERRQLPRLRRLDGRALGRREAHAGEVCNATNRSLRRTGCVKSQSREKTERDREF